MLPFNIFMDKIFRLNFFALASHKINQELFFTEKCKVTDPADAKEQLLTPPLHF